MRCREDTRCSATASPVALSDCGARGRGGNLAILLIPSRRRNATKVNTPGVHLKKKARCLPNLKWCDRSH